MGWSSEALNIVQYQKDENACDWSLIKDTLLGHVMVDDISSRIVLPRRRGQHARSEKDFHWSHISF
jgi:hypothetical protein